MSITDRLLKLDPTLNRYNEGAWQSPFDLDKVGFSSFNDAGVECEVGEFLYGLVRCLKPEFVLETGTHWGIGACYLGLALQDNNNGHLDTVEFDPTTHEIARRRIVSIGLGDIVTCHLTDARLFGPTTEVTSWYDLMFLDTEPQTRFEELVRFYDYLKPGGFVFIHDLHRHLNQIENEEHGFAWPFGELPPTIKEWVKAGSLRPFHLPTPRGLTGFYKTSDKDFKWTR